MKFRVWTLVATMILLLPSMASAAVCSAFYPVAADGRLYDSSYFVPASTSYAVFSLIRAGHSYSVEVTDPFDVVSGSIPPVKIYMNLQNGGDCTSNSADAGGAVTDTTSADPGVYSFPGRRASFVAPSTEYAYAVINNADTVGRSFRVQIVDTTLFTPGWSTFGNANTYWSLTNTSDQLTHVTLRLFDTSGTNVSAASATINAGATYSTNTFDLGTPRTVNGSATLVYDGPPGTLIATGVIYSGGANPQFVPFAPRSK